MNEMNARVRTALMGGLIAAVMWMVIQERLNWLAQQEAAAARASRYYERIQPTTHSVRPEDERGHRPDRDITPRW